MTPAAKAWVASVNARGGLAGCHPVKLIVGDDGDDPAKAKAIVKKMVEEDGVSAFVAHHGALTLGAVRPYLEQKRVPLFGSSGAYADESESEMVFLAQPTSVVGESEAYINNVLALNLPNRKIAVFWCAEVPLCSVHNDVIKKQAATKGFSVVASIRISLFAPDYTSEVLQARQAGADMIVLLTDMQTNGRLLRSANRQNFHPLVVTPGVNYDTQWPAIIGHDADGMITTAWSRPWHIDGINHEYREAMTKYQPGQIMGNSGSAAWAGMKLLEKAAGNLDRDKPTSEQIIQGVYKLSNETLGGLIPATTWPKDPALAGGAAPLHRSGAVDGHRLRASPRGEVRLFRPGYRRPDRGLNQAERRQSETGGPMGAMTRRQGPVRIGAVAGAVLVALSLIPAAAGADPVRGEWVADARASAVDLGAVTTGGFIVDRFDPEPRRWRCRISRPGRTWPPASPPPPTRRRSASSSRASSTACSRTPCPTTGSRSRLSARRRRGR